jgi:glycogen debranching enzyme
MYPSLSATRERWTRLKGGRYGLGTSEGVAFGSGEGTFFARDAAMNATFGVTLEPELARSVILAIIKHQGLRTNHRTEEEFGRVHHEFHPLQNPSLGWHAISRVWGGDANGFTIYFASDTTALFVLLVKAYAEAHGPDILDEAVITDVGQRVSVAEAVRRAAAWLADKIDKYGYVATKRHNVTGLMNSDWKDSPLAYPATDRLCASYRLPKAYVEVQAWSAEALDYASTLDASVGKRYQQQAAELRIAVLRDFWVHDQQMFAPVLVVHPDKSARTMIGKPVAIPASNEGWLLATDLFDGLNERDKQKYLVPVIRRILGPDFLTKVGIRCRGLSAPSNGVADYHGSNTVWPIDTFWLIRGLRRQGFDGAAQQLEVMLTNSVDESTVVEDGDWSVKHWEFYFVDNDGRVLWEPLTAQTTDRDAMLVSWLPDEGQAWSTVAYLAIADNWPMPCTKSVPDWVRPLDEEMSGRIRTAYSQPAGERQPFQINKKDGNRRLIKQVVRQNSLETMRLA